MNINWASRYSSAATSLFLPFPGTSTPTNPHSCGIKKPHLPAFSRILALCVWLIILCLHLLLNPQSIRQVTVKGISAAMAITFPAQSSSSGTPTKTEFEPHHETSFICAKRVVIGNQISWQALAMYLISSLRVNFGDSPPPFAQDLATFSPQVSAHWKAAQLSDRVSRYSTGTAAGCSL